MNHNHLNSSENKTKSQSKAPNKDLALISRILTFSCVDGPGNRLVIFFQGCNFNCLNCHNPHTINHCNHCGDCVLECPTQALKKNENQKVIWDKTKCIHCDKCLEVCPHNSNPKIETYHLEDILNLIRKNHIFLNGITVSGGESTLHLPFVIALFKKIKSDPELNHLTCFIDSNGHLSTQGWQRVLPYTDGVMIDLKSWQQETHLWITGKNNHRVIQSIQLLAHAEKLHELRLLHIPNRSDLLIEIEAIIQLIQSLPKDVIIRLNAFQHHGVKGEALKWDKCSKEEIEQFRYLLKNRIEHNIKTPEIII